MIGDNWFIKKDQPASVVEGGGARDGWLTQKDHLDPTDSLIKFLHTNNKL